MKFKLSTFLLVVTCVALATGLYYQRVENGQKTEKILNGGQLWHAGLHLQLLDTSDPTVLTNLIERDQIRHVQTLFRYSEDIEQFNQFIDRQQVIEREYAAAGLKWSVSQHSSTDLASDILVALKCSSADQYFSRLSESFGDEIYTEFQSGGERHSDFRAFIERSLKSPK